VYKFHLEMRPHSERIDDFLEFMHTNFRDSLSFPGCVDVVPTRDLDDPTRFVFMETWRSSDDYGRYVAWRTQTGKRVPAGVLAVERKFTVLEPISTFGPKRRSVAGCDHDPSGRDPDGDGLYVTSWFHVSDQGEPDTLQRLRVYIAWAEAARLVSGTLSRVPGDGLMLVERWPSTYSARTIRLTGTQVMTWSDSPAGAPQVAYVALLSGLLSPA
jgi:quinol monooxygenase YgiN